MSRWVERSLATITFYIGTVSQVKLGTGGTGRPCSRLDWCQLWSGLRMMEEPCSLTGTAPICVGMCGHEMCKV